MPNLSFGERVARSAWRVTPQRALSDIIGWWARRRLPSVVRTPYLASFADRYGIDVEESEKQLADYGGLQEFFTRRLRPDARPIDCSPGVIVFPADGRVVDTGIVSGGCLIDAKGVSFTLAELLADEALARTLDGGPYQVTYLSPRDYHRVHSPVSGGVVGWHYVPGTLFPVNDRSVQREPALFAKNERFVTVIEGEAGLTVVVMVAAVGVGHITASYDSDVATHAEGFCDGRVRTKQFTTSPRLEAGDELGVFNLGSTTIVVFEPNRVRIDPVPSGTPVRMGRAMGSLTGRSVS